MFKHLALAAIGFYQRHLSPRKGYSCAYRVHTGGAGCSGFGKHAISKHGLLLGLVLLRRRMSKCAWQAHQHAVCQPRVTPRRPTVRPRLGKFSQQGGFVDCDCSGCDAPACDGPSCDFPHFGCGEASSGSEAANTFCTIAEGCSACDPCAGTHADRACATGPDCCGGGSGAEREDKRLKRARKRREQARSTDADEGLDITDDFDDGDGDD